MSTKQYAVPEKTFTVIVLHTVYNYNCTIVYTVSVFPVQLSKGPHSGVTGVQETACRLLCAAGLAEMQNRKYKNSARLFCAAIIEHCNFPDVSACLLTIFFYYVVKMCVCVCYYSRLIM